MLSISRRTPTAESENDQIYRLFASERIITPQAVSQLPTPEQTEERKRRIIPSSLRDVKSEKDKREASRKNIFK